jgi:hypothetical protein
MSLGVRCWVFGPTKTDPSYPPYPSDPNTEHPTLNT